MGRIWRAVAASFCFHFCLALAFILLGRQAMVPPEAAQPIALVFSMPNGAEAPATTPDASAFKQPAEPVPPDLPPAPAEPPPLDAAPPDITPPDLPPPAQEPALPADAAVLAPLPEAAALPSVPDETPPVAVPPPARAVAPSTAKPRVEPKPNPKSSARANTRQAHAALPAPGVPIPGSQAGAPSRPPAGEIDADWRGALDGWLRGHRHYPEEARRRGDQGRVVVRFSIDRQGRVSDAELVQGSGSALLDDAVLAMLRNAVVPAFPAGMAQDPVTLTVQIRFTLER